MRFYSRLVFICNICFIVSVVLRYIEITRTTGNSEAVIRVPFIQGLLVILGYGAIFLNFIFILLSIYLLIARKLNKVPRWLMLFNIVIFAAQVAFHLYI